MISTKARSIALIFMLILSLVFLIMYYSNPDTGLIHNVNALLPHSYVGATGYALLLLGAVQWLLRKPRIDQGVDIVSAKFKNVGIVLICIIIVAIFSFAIYQYIQGAQW